MARTIRRRPDPDQQRRHRRRLILGAIIGAVVILLLAGLSFYLRLTGGPALPRAVRQRVREAERQASPTPPAQAPSDSAAAPNRPQSSAGTYPGVPAGTPPFAQQVLQAQQAGQAGDASPRTLYITDAELSAQLGEEIRKHPEVKEVNGYFEAARAYLTVRLDAKGHELNLTVVLKPTLVGGAVRFDADQAFVGQVAAPTAMAQKVQEEVAKRGTWFTPDKTGLYLEQIDLKSGVAVLRGRPVRR